MVSHGYDGEEEVLKILSRRYVIVKELHNSFIVAVFRTVNTTNTDGAFQPIIISIHVL